MATKREALIASAEKSLQKGKVDAALKDYVKVLEETPNDINILNKAGDLNVRLGRNDESITYFLRIAEFYARDGFYVRAIAMYKKINKLDPARLDIYEKLAELYVKQQLWMEAKSNYQVLADYLLKQDNLGGTIGIYQKMVGIEPQNLQLHVKLADLFTQAKRIPEALREYGVVAGALAEIGVFGYFIHGVLAKADFLSGMGGSDGAPSALTDEVKKLAAPLTDKLSDAFLSYLQSHPEMFSGLICIAGGIIIAACGVYILLRESPENISG